VNEDIESEPDLRNRKDYLDRLRAVQEEILRFDALSRRLQRFTQQGLKPEKKRVHVNDIVRQTLILLGSAIRSKGVKLESRLDAKLDSPGSGKGKGSPILADEDQIQQALMNLVLNAVAASASRRPLVAETRSLPEHVEIRVTDYGIGIPNDVRRHLFKPFFTTKKDGVGLGLFLSRILVEDNHDGSIEIVSSVGGKGTTFCLRLPYHSEQVSDRSTRFM
jgi:signal transduction histidine kinase